MCVAAGTRSPSVRPSVSAFFPRAATTTAVTTVRCRSHPICRCRRRSTTHGGHDAMTRWRIQELKIGCALIPFPSPPASLPALCPSSLFLLYPPLSLSHPPIPPLIRFVSHPPRVFHSTSYSLSPAGALGSVISSQWVRGKAPAADAFFDHLDPGEEEEYLFRQKTKTITIQT